MKFGSLPPVPEDKDLSRWCAFDGLEIDDYFPMLGYLGSCPNCGDLKVPSEFLVQYLGNTVDGTHHVFQTIEIVRCAGCGGIVDKVSVLCQNPSVGMVNVTEEFMSITERYNEKI